jgi:hypothetical protein
MHRSIRLFAAATGIAAGCAAHAAVTVTPLVMAGDVYGGFNIATGFASSENFAINNAGAWLIETTTTNPDGNANGILLSGTGTGTGTTLLTENDPVTNPVGAAISSFDSVTLNNSGNSAFNLFFRGATTSTDSGVYFNTTQIILESAIATAPGLSPSTPYIGWFEVYINDANQILMVASVDDPAIASTVDRALVRIDNPSGAATQTLLLKEGDEVVTGRFLTDVATGPHNTAFAGQWTVTVPDLDGATTDDSGVLRHNGTSWSFVAREGEAAPVSGRLWASLASAPVDVNSNGDWVMRGTLNAPTTDDSIIVKNGTTIVAQEGSGNAAIGSFTFTTFGTGAVKIDDAGHVFYYGDWNDPDTTRDTGLFRDAQLLVQKGVTTVATGEVVTDISAVQDNFTVSDNGQYVLFEGTLTDTLNAISRRGTIMVRISCPADFNGSGAVTVQDIFDFLAAYFANAPGADFNGQGGVTVQDIFDFLAAYFTPCT